MSQLENNRKSHIDYIKEVSLMCNIERVLEQMEQIETLDLESLEKLSKTIGAVHVAHLKNEEKIKELEEMKEHATEEERKVIEDTINLRRHQF